MHDVQKCVHDFSSFFLLGPVAQEKMVAKSNKIQKVGCLSLEHCIVGRYQLACEWYPPEQAGLMGGDYYRNNALKCWQKVMKCWLKRRSGDEYPATWEGGLLSLLETLGCTGR